MNRADVELLTVEYIEEVLNAGGARFMDSVDLPLFIHELVLNNFDLSSMSAYERAKLQEHALSTAQMCLLPESFKKRGIEIDAQTVALLRESLR